MFQGFRISHVYVQGSSAFISLCSSCMHEKRKREREKEHLQFRVCRLLDVPSLEHARRD